MVVSSCYVSVCIIYSILQYYFHIYYSHPCIFYINWLLELAVLAKIFVQFTYAAEAITKCI